MFRKPTKKRAPVQARQRQEEELSGDEDSSVIKDVKRRKRANPFQQSAGAEESTSSDDSDEGTGNLVAEHAFAASGSAAPLGPSDQGATATLDVDTDYAADAQAQFERVQQQLKDGLVKDGKTIYKGQAMYGAKEAKDTVKGNASSGLNRIGPIRAPQFLRQTVRWDYAPDICKDFKETGFCTFGDSCKFLHDRSDYKHGWEIERDYASGRLDKINEDEDEFPEDCYICGKPFVSPVVTRCKHYFCETCALSAFRKNKRCAVCGENTGGVFNIAKDLIAKLTGTAKSKRKEESDSDSCEEHEASCSHHTVKEEVQTVKEEQPEEDIVEVKQEVQEESDEGDNEEGSEGSDEHEDDGQDEVQESVEIKMEEIEQDDVEADEDDAEYEEQSESEDEDPRT
ncbi:hypothetical protein COOONC_10757 [Cooperia oncophora]